MTVFRLDSQKFHIIIKHGSIFHSATITYANLYIP